MTFPVSPIAHAIAAGANGATTGAIDTSTANLLPLCIGWYTGITADPSTVGDSKFNTWVSTTKRVSPDGTLAQRIWYAAGTPTVGSGHTFSATGSSIFANLSVTAWSGAHASPFDAESGAGSNAANSLQPGAFTPAQNDSLAISGLTASGSGTLSIDSSFNISDSIGFLGGNFEGGAHAWFIQGTAASLNPTWSNTTGGYLVTSMVAFKPSAGGGGGGLLPFNPPPLIGGFRSAMGGNFQG